MITRSWKELWVYATLCMALILVLGSDNSGNIYWWKDGTYAVYPDTKGHMGLVIPFGHGTVLSESLNQKINTMSSTETKTVAISDNTPKSMRT